MEPVKTKSGPAIPTGMRQDSGVTSKLPSTESPVPDSLARTWREKFALWMTELGQWLIRRAIVFKTKARLTELPHFFIVLRIGVFMRQPAQDLTVHRRFTWAVNERMAVHVGSSQIQNQNPPVKGWRYHWCCVRVF